VDDTDRKDHDHQCNNNEDTNSTRSLLVAVVLVLAQYLDANLLTMHTALLSIIISYPSFTLNVSRSHAARRGKVANPRLGIGPQEATPKELLIPPLMVRFTLGFGMPNSNRHSFSRL
jgi:hypothetical protein